MPYRLTTLPLAPLLIKQGKQVRANTVKLPEPEGERIGVVGNGEPFKLLVIGDSSGAGVGAEHQDLALLGQTLKRLSKDHEVSFTLFAKTGVTTASTLKHMHKIEDRGFDAVIVALGVNDVTKMVNPKQWQAQQVELRNRLINEFGAKKIIFSSVPDMHRFPALPQPLRWYMGQRAAHLNRLLQQCVADSSCCHLLKLKLETDPDLMAADGFHPSAKTYSYWAEQAVLAMNIGDS